MQALRPISISVRQFSWLLESLLLSDSSLGATLPTSGPCRPLSFERPKLTRIRLRIRIRVRRALASLASSECRLPPPKSLRVATRDQCARLVSSRLARSRRRRACFRPIATTLRANEDVNSRLLAAIATRFGTRSPVQLELRLEARLDLRAPTSRQTAPLVAAVSGSRESAN